MNGQIGRGRLAAELLTAGAHDFVEGGGAFLGGGGAQVFRQEGKDVLDARFCFAHHDGEEAERHARGVGGARDDLVEAPGVAEGIGEIE